MKLRLLGVLAVIYFSLQACVTPTIKHENPNNVANPAGLIFHGGPIYTMNPAQPQVEAIMVRNGRIERAGDLKTIQASHSSSHVRVIDLAGRTLLPGLTDAHMHLFGLGRATFYIDLVATKSILDIKRKVAEAVSKAKPGQWVRGRGWDQNDWADHQGEFPQAKDLDDVSPDNPVALTRVDGHALWVNSSALKKAKIDASTRSSHGGQIVRQGEQATGVFIDNAMSLVRAKIPAFTREQLKQAALKAQQMCLASGLSQVHDMGVSEEQLSILKELDAAGQLKLRVYAMIDGDSKNLESLFEQKPHHPRSDKERLTIRGVKFFADGALGSRGAALFEPYEDDPKNKGLILTPVTELERRIRLAKEHGFQVSIHAIGDRGNHTVLDLYEKIFTPGRNFGRDSNKPGRGINKSGPSPHDYRPRVEHAQVLLLEDIPRFAQLGVIASMQPTHATSDMPWAEKRVGPNRIKGAYAWRSLMTASATIAAGSDSPVESIEPRLGLYAAMTRQDKLGQPEQGWRPSEKMTPNEAVAAFTKHAAWASFREKELGQIKVGFLADMTVLNVDPIKDQASALLNASIEMTVIHGEIVFEKK
jgi:predicted amidohydrolase YtcJ